MKFKIELNEQAYGSEHANAFIRAASGAKVTLREEIRPGLWLTDYFREEWRDIRNDYVHDGFLLVMPSKDGRTVAR